MSVKQKMSPIKRDLDYGQDMRLFRASNHWSICQRLTQAFNQVALNEEKVACLQAESEELDREIRLLRWQLRMAKKSEMLKKGTDYTMKDALARDAGPHLESLRATVESCLYEVTI